MEKFQYKKIQETAATQAKLTLPSSVLDQAPTVEMVRRRMEDTLRKITPVEAQDDPVGVNDPVEAPRHYQGTGMEVWDVLKAFLSAEELIGYCRGNIIKYQLRYKQKGGLQDLRKADWYADKLKRLVSGQP